MGVIGIKKVYKVFLKIIKSALEGKPFVGSDTVSKEEWLEILRLAEMHSIMPLVYQAAYAVPELQDFGAVLRSKVRRLVMLQTVKTDEFLHLYEKLKAAGVAPLVVKGLICRKLYPEPDLRMSSDEDLLIPEAQFNQSRAIMEEWGMHTALEEKILHTAHEVPYRKRDGVLYIEAHKSLFPPEADAYGDWNRFFEGVFDRAVEDGAVRTLSYTDHLFYLICHAFKHFLHSGFGIRQVCDIVMYANVYGTQVDWDAIYHNCCEIHADVFAAALFRIGKNYLIFDAKKAAYPAYWQKIEIDETDMLEDLLSGGVYGGATMSRRHSSNMTLDAVSADKQGKKAKTSLKNTLFPSAKSLEGRYPYLKKRPFLLPAAWVSRFVQYGKEVKAAKNSTAESLKIGSQRVDLLRKYRVIR